MARDTSEDARAACREMSDAPDIHTVAGISSDGSPSPFRTTATMGVESKMAGPKNIRVWMATSGAQEAWKFSIKPHMRCDDAQCVQLREAQQVDDQLSPVFKIHTTFDGCRICRESSDRMTVCLKCRMSSSSPISKPPKTAIAADSL